MATLTETAIVIRKTIRYSIYGIIIIMISRMAYNVGLKVYQNYFPPPPPPPTLSFGKLPKLPFPERPLYDKVRLVLETPEGNLPSLVPQVNVYFMPKSISDIKSLTRAKQEATSLGFDPEGRQLSESVMFFENKLNPAQSMQMNIITNVFSINYTLKDDPNLVFGNPPTPETAIKTVQAYSNKAGLNQTDYKGEPTTELLRVENTEFTRAIALSEADMIKVNLFRKTYNDFPALTPDKLTGNIWFIVGRGKGNNNTAGSLKILTGEYKYYPVDETQLATYPIKSSEKAWEDLTSGKGFIANFGENGLEDEIKIRRVYLAYYDAGVYTPFYQPIIVFDGDNNFSAYVPAVTDDYYGADSSEYKSTN